MNNLDRVYLAIKEHNAKSSVINGIQTSPVPAYTGDIKSATGLELDEIHTILETLIKQGRVVMQDTPLTNTGRDNYGKILNYSGLFAIR